MPDKIASGVAYCTSGGLICNGLYHLADWIYHLDWNFIGLVSGAVLGVATFMVNLHFKRQEGARNEESRRGQAEQERLRTEAITQYLQKSPANAPEVAETINNALKLVEKQ